MSGEHELPTASVGRYVASADRPPPWTTLHRLSEPQGSTYRSQFGVRTSGTTSHRRLGQAQIVVLACMLLAVPVMAMTTGAAQWLTAAAYGVAAAALWTLHRSRRRFE